MTLPLSSRQRLVFLIFTFLLFIFGGFWFFNFHKTPRSLSPTPSSYPSSTHLIQTNHLTNFLFLGIGGQGHQAPDLTDTIILISYNHQTGHLTLLPLPRDLWFDNYHAKINTLYHYSLDKYPQTSLNQTKKMFSQVIGLPIHYLAILDFHGFVNLIDLVGGVDVDVKRSFDDYKYPIPGKETAEPVSARYEHLHFEAGYQHMNGQLALKFARSRHALGPEGSDFARSRRQEQVIRAFLKKLFSSSILLQPRTLSKLKNQLQQSLLTDLPLSTLPTLTKLALSLKKNPNNLLNATLVPLLKEPKSFQAYGGQWVLIPRTNWQAIHDYIRQQVNR